MRLPQSSRDTLASRKKLMKRSIYNFTTLGFFLLSALLAGCTTQKEEQDRTTRTTKLSINLGTDSRRLGNHEARIGIVEFYDFECSYCQQFHNQTLPKLKSTYIDTGVLLYVVKDFPLKMHKNAFQAAVAANCAGEQDQYWAMQGRLLAFQDKLGAKFIYKLVREINLDKSQFKSCVMNIDRQQDVKRDYLLGRQMGVSGTPTFFIGTIKNNILNVTGVATGVLSFEEIEKQINTLKLLTTNNTTTNIQ